VVEFGFLAAHRRVPWRAHSLRPERRGLLDQVRVAREDRILKERHDAILQNKT
jgi:hypothetical protein